MLHKLKNLCNIIKILEQHHSWNSANANLVVDLKAERMPWQTQIEFCKAVAVAQVIQSKW